MSKIKDIKYNKEYIELIQAFVPNVDKGCISLKRNKEDLFLDINNKTYNTKITKKLSTEKHTIKYHLYKILSKVTNEDLAWGTLVGVSPLKLFKNIDNKLGRTEAIRILRDDYLLDISKIDLGYRILDHSKKYIDLLKGYSIYINIPFCPSKCSYCSYPTYGIDEEIEKAYVDTVLRELEGLSLVLKTSPTAVYIGGGTPSTISNENLGKIIDEINSLYPEVLELTVEIGRPDTINLELLKMLKEKSVDRISINPQTLNQDTLEKIGRNHTTHEFEKAYNLARDIDFASINVDLIAGLPGENVETFKSTLSKVVELKPENISIHYLAIKKGSELYEDGTDRRSKNYSEYRDKILENTYTPYYLYRQKNTQKDSENIGYTLDGNSCIYNILMMEDLETVIGVGMGSSTKIIDKGINRYMNPRTIKSYIEEIDKTIEDKLRLIGGSLEDK